MEPQADDGVARGFAAPSGGDRPCQIWLKSGPELLAVASCDGYSAAAEREQIRLGWCGFALAGLQAAVALGRPSEIVCAVSGKNLAAWSREDLAAMALSPRRPPLSATGLRRFIKGLGGCGDVRQIIPFIEPFLERRSTRELIAALWRYFLRRHPLETEIDMVAGELPGEWQLEFLLHRVVSSEEFRKGPGYPLPGPFDPDFPFGSHFPAAGAAGKTPPRPMKST